MSLVIWQICNDFRLATFSTELPKADIPPFTRSPRWRGQRAVSDGSADAVAYGRIFLANPDLPMRLSRRGPLNVPDTGNFYGGDERGHIDYPEWAKSGT